MFSLKTGRQKTASNIWSKNVLVITEELITDLLYVAIAMLQPFFFFQEKESFTFSIVGLRNKESHYQFNLFVFILVFVFVFLNSKEVLAQYKGTCKPMTMSTIRSHFSSLRERFLRFASECSGPCDRLIVFESLWKWTHSLNV